MIAAEETLKAAASSLRSEILAERVTIGVVEVESRCQWLVETGAASLGTKSGVWRM